jgi:hypothetical protein
MRIAMKFLRSLLIGVWLTVMLVGCGPVYKREYAFVPPKSDVGKMCTAQCVQGKNRCEQRCRRDTERCRAHAREEAIYQFEQYKRERRRLGQEVKKSINDFDRGYTCETACNCEPTFRDCYAACGGQVLQRDVCVAFCDK